MSALQTHPPAWRVVLALGLLYISWGTTYLATGAGVKTVPPLLFGGSRLFLAGLVLLGFLRLTGRRVKMSGRDFGRTWLVGVFLFVGGNGLVNVAQQTVPSGIASVLVATTPFWMALLETISPTGERLSVRGWLGLLLGLAGVVLLTADKLSAHLGGIGVGYLLVIGSAISWAFGAILQRRSKVAASPVACAAWQMVLGGASLVVLGCSLGHAQELRVERITPTAIAAYFYLLVIGSLIGFVAFTWLLSHVSSALAGSYAYVNPVVALLVGWLIADEVLSARVLCGMMVILAGVALVRTGSGWRHPAVTVAVDEPKCETTPAFADATFSESGES